MPADPLGALARAPRSLDPALIAAVRRAMPSEADDPSGGAEGRDSGSDPSAPSDESQTGTQSTGPLLTGPQFWARARVPRPPVTRSRTGITVSPYLQAPEEQIGTPEMLRSVRLAAPGIVRTANEILDIEGPMPLQRLITLIARRFGIRRLDPQRRYHLGRVVGPQFRIIDDFAWPNGIKPATWRSARRVGDPADRRLTDISREELVNAMEFVLGDVDSLDREALLAETAGLLGYARIPGPQRAWVIAALEQGLQAGRFLEDDGVRLP